MADSAARKRKAGRRDFGTIRKLGKDGNYQVRYTDADGRRHTAPEKFSDHDAAEKHLRQIGVDIDTGTWVDQRLGEVTVEEWAEAYMAARGGALKPKTRHTYDGLLASTINPYLGQRKIGSLRLLDVDRWITDLSTGTPPKGSERRRRPLSPSRVQQSYRLLSQIMGYAVKNNRIAKNPCKDASLPRLPKPHPTIITPEQAVAIAAELPEPYRLLVQLLTWTGARVGEAYALRRSSFSPLTGRLRIEESLADLGSEAGLHFGPTKTHQAREVTLPAYLAERLKAHLDSAVGPDGDALLFTKNGKPIRHADFLRSIWHPACKRAGLTGVTPHSLRASHASWLMDDGRSILDVAARLGHDFASVTTRHYARAMKGRDQALAEALDAAARAATEAVEKRAGEGASEVARAIEGQSSGTARLRLAP